VKSKASLAQLNAAQRAAVTHVQGPLLILAGAGSGKTRVVTQRIAHLVQEGGVRPEAILAVSFTNKAAKEMAERMVPLLGADTPKKLFLSTFHSFGLRFIGEERETLGLGSKFVIFDQGDSLGVVREVLRGLRNQGAARKLDPSALLARISHWKNKLVDPKKLAVSDFEYDAVAAEVYPEYVERLHAMRAVDFDDLVLSPVRLLREREDVRTRWQDRFRHLMVDEFQDTSHMQLELVRLLANPLRNVCVVGDDDQSIYAFRGADVSNILDFERHFPGTTVVKLEDNYRSTQAILTVANTAIERSPGRRHGKTLRAARGGGDRVRMCVLKDQDTEARMVALEIADLKRDGKKLSDIAVLYRSSLQARLIEQELRLNGIAYKVFGGTQFFDRKEVKDTAAYLRAVVNPRDEISLRRILNYPARGIGTTTVQRVETHALASGISFADALGRIDTIDSVPDNAKRATKQLLGQIGEARARMTKGEGLVHAARALVTQVGLQEDIVAAAEGAASGSARWSNVEHLMSWLERYEKSSNGDQKSLQQFLLRLTLRGDAEEEDTGAWVTLSTLHAAKGLEFPVVFLIGCVEGQLPHSRTTDPKVTEVNPTDVEEERRLFYVGVTRAKDRLYLTRATTRTMRGKTMPMAPSRFLEGLPEDQLEPYKRAERQELDFAEIAQLGRAFLERAKTQ